MNVLTAIDFSDVTHNVVDEASRLATALKARLRLFHVAPSNTTDFDDDEPGVTYIKRRAEEAHRKLVELEAVLQERQVEVECVVVQGQPVAEILRELERTQPELLVMGSHGHGALAHLLCGSVTSAVLKRGHRPVVIVPRCDLPSPSIHPSADAPAVAAEGVKHAVKGGSS